MLKHYILRDKAFNIAKNPIYDNYQRGLASSVYKFFNKKPAGSSFESEILSNQQLAEELHKTIIRKFEQRKVYSSFKDNIWGADFADMQLISKYNKGYFLLYVIYSKYAWVLPLKGKKGIKIINLFQEILIESNRKPNKIWVDKGSTFYKGSINHGCMIMI